MERVERALSDTFRMSTTFCFGVSWSCFDKLRLPVGQLYVPQLQNKMKKKKTESKTFISQICRITCHTIVVYEFFLSPFLLFRRCASYSVTSVSASFCTLWVDSRPANGNPYKLKVKTQSTPVRLLYDNCFRLFLFAVGAIDGCTYSNRYSKHLNRTLECVRFPFFSRWLLLMLEFEL